MTIIDFHNKIREVVTDGYSFVQVSTDISGKIEYKAYSNKSAYIIQPTIEAVIEAVRRANAPVIEPQENIHVESDDTEPTGARSEEYSF